MNKIIVILMIMMLSISFSHAATRLKKAQSIMVDVTLNQSMNNANTFITNNKISLTQDDDWTAMGSSQSTSTITNPNQSHQSPISNQFLALMKIIQADNKHVTLQFLILNQESSHYSVAQPRLIVSYNQKGGIHIHDKNNNIDITVIAKKINDV